MNDINNRLKNTTMDKKKSIAALQAYATGLAAQSLQHKAESKIFAAQGFTKLAEKYAEHSAEEMGWVEQFMDRILDLGGTPLVLQNLVLSLQEDFKTYDILRGYALDEEEDMYWSETQLELIEKIGLQNWLVKQL